MIVLRITSGLGNQMYQYAFYTLLKEKYKDTEVLCDTTWFHNNHEGRKYELETIFSGVEGSLFEIKKAGFLQIVKLSGKIPNLFDGSIGKIFEAFRRYPNRLLKDSLLKKRKPFILEQLSDELPDVNILSEDNGVSNSFYDKVMSLDITKDWYITGFFIEEKYYSNVLERVREKFVFPKISESSNIEYAKQISECDSISIHVRRGDYLSDLYKDKFLTLGKEYYEKAINHVSELIINKCNSEGREPNIKYFIFSDDEEFVKKEFNWLNNKVIVSGNDGDLCYRDMQLMSLCKHNITANSTFSQWGALLNTNDGHITVYPKAYMVDSDNEKKEDPSWIRI